MFRNLQCLMYIMKKIVKDFRNNESWISYEYESRDLNTLHIEYVENLSLRMRDFLLWNYAQKQ